MPTLNVRHIPEHVHTALRIRAAKAGRSMESEARDILARACLGEEPRKSASSLLALVDRLYGKQLPRGVVEALIDERRREHEAE